MKIGIKKCHCNLSTGHSSILTLLCVINVISYSTGNPTVNLALKKPALMSSAYNTPVYAVDGRIGTDNDNDTNGLCSQTKSDDWAPWLMIDLRGVFIVDIVIVSNRWYAHQKLHSFVIELFDQNPQRCPDAISEVCFNFTGAVGKKEVKTFTCDSPTRGRFLRIRKWEVNDTDDVLTLCEVQVFGNAVNTCKFPFNLAVTKGVRMVSDYAEVITGSTPVECADKCGKHKVCLAFNFNVNTQQCQLISFTFNEHRQNDTNWNFYGSDSC